MRTDKLSKAQENMSYILFLLHFFPKMTYLLLFAAILFGVSAHAQSSVAETTDQTPLSTEATTVTTSIPIYFLSNEAPEATWSPQSTQSIIVEADVGYKISFNVTDCNIDGENGEYATITTDDLNNGVTFTYTVGSHPAYLYNTNRLLGDFFGTNASNFTAVFKRFGEQLTTITTEIPTTTISLPSPSENDSSTLEVYLEGKAAIEYDDELVELLVDAIVNMASEYCENENFPLNGSITSSNVVIEQLVSCPLNWQNADICVQLIFAVPVNLMEDTDSLWTGYQLTADHLRIMWLRYASTYLPDWTTYYFSPDTSKLKWGIVLACVVIGAFVILITVIRCCSISKVTRRRKLSDAASIISTSDRNSQTSLPPHYLQETPPLFENAYPMYNPEKGTTYSEPSYTKPVQYNEYQDISPEIKKQPDDEDEESRA